MLVSKECFERGCSCYDDRVDKDPVEVVERQWVGLTDDDRAALREMATFMDETDCSHLLSLAEERLKEKNR
jgi:hypothetical protein